jgi:putative acetyltransferase
MRTHPEHLRKGVAAALLEHSIGQARAPDLRRTSLETAFEPALAHRRGWGFVNGWAFGDDTHSAFEQMFHRSP